MNIQNPPMIRNNYNCTQSSNSPILLKTLNHKIDNNIKFKGDKESTITKYIAKNYSEKLMNSDKFDKFSKALGKLNWGDITKHLQTLGSFITSGAYIRTTLKNDNLEKKKRKTLAINQGLVFGVSTASAYTVDKVIKGFNKKLESHYIAIQEKKILEHPEIAKSNYGGRLRGLSTLASLLTFTMIYRYISPVLITPAANWIGRKLDSRNKKKPSNNNMVKDNNKV